LMCRPEKVCTEPMPGGARMRSFSNRARHARRVRTSPTPRQRGARGCRIGSRRMSAPCLFRRRRPPDGQRQSQGRDSPRRAFHEPMVNRTYADMARHYGTAIVAGREQARRRGGTGSRYTAVFFEIWAALRINNPMPRSLRVRRQRSRRASRPTRSARVRDRNNVQIGKYGRTGAEHWANRRRSLQRSRGQTPRSRSRMSVATSAARNT